MTNKLTRPPVKLIQIQVMMIQMRMTGAPGLIQENGFENGRAHYSLLTCHRAGIIRQAGQHQRGAIVRLAACRRSALNITTELQT